MPTDPRPDFTPDWPTCLAVPGCRGIQVAGESCLAHAQDGGTAFLSELSPGANLDLRGTVLNWDRLIKAVTSFLGSNRYHFGNVSLDWSWFSGDTWLSEAHFDGSIEFKNVYFSGDVEFWEMTCGEQVSFAGAQFDGSVWFAGVDARRIDFRQARFAKSASFDLHATEISFAGAEFEAGSTIKAGWGSVDAAEVFFGASSSIGGSRRVPSAGPWAEGDQAAPRVTSLAGSDVSNLVLVDVDLSDCTFDGAYRLDQLQMDGRFLFASPPGRWRYTRRRVLADEREWRDWLHIRPARSEVGPARLVVQYRSLRKSFEDSKNEAGAGDFYYGEMEMRRHSEETSRAEKTILWLYWLLSGYGQRASRALAALFVVVVTVTTLLTVWGQDFGLAARIAVGAVVFRADDTELTAAGEWTVLTARFLGPVLLALAVLAIRARVKR